MLKLELMLDGKKRTFTEAHANLKHMKKCAKFLADVEDEILSSDEQFEEAINLICEIFKDEEVNYDNVMEGLSPDDWNTQIMDVIFKIVDGETKKKGKSTRLQMVEIAQKRAVESMTSPGETTKE